MPGRVAAAFVETALWLLARLPLGIAQALGGFAGRVASRLNTRATRQTRANLELSFPTLSAHEVELRTRASLRETGRLIGELGMIASWDEQRWSGCIRQVIGAELLDGARRRECGALILVPHLGNWELLNLYLGRSYRLIAMYSPPRRAALDPIVRRIRCRTGSTLVPATTAGVRAMLRGLTEGRVVAVLPDQVPDRRSGVWAPFFGVPAFTMTLPQRLATRTHAVVLIGSACRLEDGTFEIRFASLEGWRADASTEGAATLLNREVETLVRQYPDQYQWEYRRFKQPMRQRHPQGALD